jgi:choline dehydrogenase-like flavoprotein
MLCSSTHPGYTGALSHGFANEMGDFMQAYPRLTSQYSVIDDENPGSIRLNRNGDALYNYTSNGVDLRKIRDFLLKSAQILLAAGAQEVVLPTNRPIRLRSEQDLQRLKNWQVRPNDLAMAGPHPMGTARMAQHARNGVVDLNCEHHAVKNLFVADSSVFPTSLSVDPSFSIMARAAMTADYIQATRTPG